MTDNNQLVQVVKNAGLEENKVDSLLKSFSTYFNEAKIIAEEAKNILVTDESQIDLMQKARENRLQLKEIRINAEKTRVTLKEQSLREGRAIDGVNNLIKALIAPVEEHLERQEKFAEMKEKARLESIYSERLEKLSKYVDDVSLYNIKEMTDEVFANLLLGCKSAYDAKIEAQKKADEEAIEKEKKERTYRDRMYNLNRFYDFIDIGKLTVDTSEEDYQVMLKEGQTAKEKHDSEQEKIRKENEELQKKAEADRKAKEESDKKLQDQIEAQKKLKEEAEAKLKAEKEAQEKKEREAKLAEENKIKAEEESKRKALLAPDKDKLIEFATVIDKLIAPSLASREAGLIIEKALVTLSDVSSYIREKSKAL